MELVVILIVAIGGVCLLGLMAEGLNDEIEGGKI